ncbi:MAG: TetR family transcriptional regulator [Gallionellaceae bacterium]|nr:TetR family transcriptional regulator [Gallionellaceae bacterium]
MARRTKEEAQETRALILDTAENVFRDKGVSRTSLAEIAQQAGVTRGAIYWHFENKADLFTAMCDRATLPLEALLENMADPDQMDPLGLLRRAGVQALALVEQDGRCRRVFEILTLKCEYVDELAPNVQRRRECRMGAREVFRMALENARRRGQVPADLDTALAAVALLAYIDGLIMDWGLEPTAYSLAGQAGPMLDFFFSGLTGGQG